jgi:hypothetical protein
VDDDGDGHAVAVVEFDGRDGDRDDRSAGDHRGADLDATGLGAAGGLDDDQGLPVSGATRK